MRPVMDRRAGLVEVKELWTLDELLEYHAAATAETQIKARGAELLRRKLKGVRK